jgi:hypothetical protein
MEIHYEYQTWRTEMNERIRQLAEQAGYLPDSFDIGHWDMPECKKFAELIVRECICQCDDENSQKYIMSHFGFTEKDWS